MSDDVDVTKEDLTDKQIELLEMIREDPDATQKEFAEEQDVLPGTVSHWKRDEYAWCKSY